jgi:hypothetical protein
VTVFVPAALKLTVPSAEWLTAPARNTWNFAAKWAAAGKQIQYKSTFLLAPDLASATQKGEISVDGTTWAPWFETKYTKAQPAPKK